MAIVHTLSRLRFRAVIILKASILPFELSYTIVFLSEIERAVTGLGITQMGCHLKRISRQMNPHI